MLPNPMKSSMIEPLTLTTPLKTIAIKVYLSITLSIILLSKFLLSSLFFSFGLVDLGYVAP
jgi:hypothetical protein